MNPSNPVIAPDKTSLVVDGSSSSIFVGLLDASGKWLAKVRKQETPLEGLFTSVEAVLEGAGLPISEVKSFVYCEGPGSVLGLRLCAMAIQTWGHLCNSPVSYFSYNSMDLSAALVLLDYPDISEALLISDWKKNAWHSVSIRERQPAPISTIDDLAVKGWQAEPLFYLPQRKGWQTVPESAVAVEYSPQRLPEVMYLLKRTKKIELYSKNTNVFQKWVPQRHRLSN